MEEMLSNVAGARQIFERWMEWEPDEQAWHSYINMELRYKETDRARNIYERYVMVHPEVKNWVKYAKFEERQSNIGMEYSKETPLQGGGGRGRFLNKILYREAPPCGPTPYPIVILFLTENVLHFVYLSDKWHPLHKLVYSVASSLTAVNTLSNHVARKFFVFFTALNVFC